MALLRYNEIALILDEPRVRQEQSASSGIKIVVAAQISFPEFDVEQVVWKGLDKDDRLISDKMLVNILCDNYLTTQYNLSMKCPCW